MRASLAVPDDFIYTGHNVEMFATWSLGPVIAHRDSSDLELSNAAALLGALGTREEFRDQYAVERFQHWAVGWVEHLTFKARDADSWSASPIYQFILDWLKNPEKWVREGANEAEG